jgi:hypothetical protein
LLKTKAVLSKKPLIVLGGLVKTLIIIAIALFASSVVSAQQNYVELRGAAPHYDSEEYSRDLPYNLNVDFVHSGVTGQDQFFAGLGYHITPAKGVMVTPYLYAVAGTNGQRGAMVAVNASVERGKWKATAFLGRFLRAKGSVPSYTALDTGDVTRSVTKRVDVGVSTGFFRTEGQWNLQSGPIDAHGAWAVSYRFGQTNEVRLTRIFSF